MKQNSALNVFQEEAAKYIHLVQIDQVAQKIEKTVKFQKVHEAGEEKSI